MLMPKLPVILYKGPYIKMMLKILPKKGPKNEAMGAWVTSVKMQPRRSRDLVEAIQKERCATQCMVKLIVVDILQR